MLFDGYFNNFNSYDKGYHLKDEKINSVIDKLDNDTVNKIIQKNIEFVPEGEYTDKDKLRFIICAVTKGASRTDEDIINDLLNGLDLFSIVFHGKSISSNLAELRKLDNDLVDICIKFYRPRKHVPKDVLSNDDWVARVMLNNSIRACIFDEHNHATKITTSILRKYLKEMVVQEFSARQAERYAVGKDYKVSNNTPIDIIKDRRNNRFAMFKIDYMASMLSDDNKLKLVENNSDIIPSNITDEDKIRYVIAGLYYTENISNVSDNVIKFYIMANMNNECITLKDGNIDDVIARIKKTHKDKIQGYISSYKSYFKLPATIMSNDEFILRLIITDVNRCYDSKTVTDMSSNIKEYMSIMKYVKQEK